MTTTSRLALVPRNGLFCRDGRGWHTSASGRGHGLERSWPSTILGTLRSAWRRSAWGLGEEARSGTLFGPDDWRGTRAAATVAKRRRRCSAPRMTPPRTREMLEVAVWLQRALQATFGGA